MFSVNTEAFSGADGKVTGLRAHEVKMVDGRFQKVEGSDFDLDADLVLLAMGFVGPERNELLEGLGVTYDERGNIKRNDDFAAVGVPEAYSWPVTPVAASR